MSKIIQVTPTDQYFSITWKLTVRCNYDCMYCPTNWHNNHGPEHSLDSLQSAWNSIVDKTKHLNLPYKISFSGGEVTTNKNFLPFALWLKSNFGDQIFKTILTTNGSASASYYQKLYSAIDNISFSLHSEHVDEKKFFSTVIDLHRQLSPEKFLHVNIMDEFWNRERISQYVKLLTEHKISHSINEIDYGLQTRTIPIIKGKLNLDF